MAAKHFSDCNSADIEAIKQRLLERGYVLKQCLIYGRHGELWTADRSWKRNIYGCRSKTKRETKRPLNNTTMCLMKICHDDLIRHENEETLTFLAAHPHPNIMAVYEWFVDLDYFFLAQEYLGEKMLAEYIARAAPEPCFSEAKAARIFKQILGVVHFLHTGADSLEFSHGDIKPENIWLAPNGDIKLTGWHFTVATNADPPHHHNLSPSYAPPELLFDKVITRHRALIDASNPYGTMVWYDAKAADVWSLGVVLCEILTGEQPFDPYSDPTQLEEDMLEQRLRCLDGFSMEVEDLIRKMVIYNPVIREWTCYLIRHPWLSQEREFTKVKTRMPQVRRPKVKARIPQSSRSHHAVRTARSEKLTGLNSGDRVRRQDSNESLISKFTTASFSSLSDCASSLDEDEYWALSGKNEDINLRHSDELYNSVTAVFAFNSSRKTGKGKRAHRLSPPPNLAGNLTKSSTLAGFNCLPPIANASSSKFQSARLPKWSGPSKAILMDEKAQEFKANEQNHSPDEFIPGEGIHGTDKYSIIPPIKPHTRPRKAKKAKTPQNKIKALRQYWDRYCDQYLGNEYTADTPLNELDDDSYNAAPDPSCNRELNQMVSLRKKLKSQANYKKSSRKTEQALLSNPPQRSQGEGAVSSSESDKLSHGISRSTKVRNRLTKSRLTGTSSAGSMYDSKSSLSRHSIGKQIGSIQTPRSPSSSPSSGMSLHSSVESANLTAMDEITGSIYKPVLSKQWKGTGQSTKMNPLSLRARQIKPQLDPRSSRDQRMSQLPVMNTRGKDDKRLSKRARNSKQFKYLSIISKKAVSAQDNTKRITSSSPNIRRRSKVSDANLCSKFPPGFF